MADLGANSHDPAAAALRNELALAMQELNTLLNEDFRLEPIAL